jgi:hypothetical protein
MEFDKVKAKLKSIGLDNTRVDNDDYFEAVIKKDSVSKVVQILEGLLGKAVWPSQNKVPKEAERTVKNLGGLRRDQMLFFLNENGISLFAMFWPWQDGERITIKMGKV